MKEVLLDLVTELLAFVALGVVGSVLGLAGFLMEDLAFANLLTGATVIGLWYLYMGSLALFVAVYLIGVRELPARIESIRAMVSD